jgi:hypothetical protein
VIERWLVAIRDHPNRPPLTQRHVLTCLALRLDWATGRGYASVKQLSADADASKVTVWRATTWAQISELLLRTRRGHYISAQTTIASEWQLISPVDNPAQGATGETLATTQGFNGSDPRFQQSQPKVSAEMDRPGFLGGHDLWEG